MTNHASCVSVIIPCYNAAPWIRETLRSVFSQNDVELQVIVVDDGSTDASAEIVAREFPQVELFRTAQGGQCRARNLALQHARGEVIQFLDADDLLMPHKIQTQLACLRVTDADIVYSDWQKFFVRAEGRVAFGEIIVRALGADAASALVRGEWSPPHAYLFRREIVERAGGFPEAYPFTGDARFTIECALRGARFVHQPGMYARYRITAEQLSRSNPRAFLRECLSSTREAQTWWEARAELGSARRAALLDSYAMVARASYALDRDLFWDAYRALLQLEPHYHPPAPRMLRILSQLVGYPRAEAVARVYRRAKRVLKRASDESFI